MQSLSGQFFENADERFGNFVKDYSLRNWDDRDF
jgi:hypothetical protein